MQDNQKYRHLIAVKGANMKIYRSLLLLLLVVCAVLALSSAAVASDISGTVNYYGAKTGRIYITLSSQYNSSQSYGVSIASSGTYTIRGVPEGGYILRAYLDAVGNREPHPSDPAFIDSSIYVPANDVSGVNITLDDPSPVSPQPPAARSCRGTPCRWHSACGEPISRAAAAPA